MDPIISIYDMLLKRHRQLRKDEFVSPKENTLHRRPPPNDATQPSIDHFSDLKVPRWRVGVGKIAGEAKDVSASRLNSHMITAAHLTQRSSGKKEAIQQYMGKLAAKKQKPSIPATANCTLTESANSSGSAVPKKMKLAVRLKPKGNKTLRSSGSSHSRKRVILSPRNTNRLPNSYANKRDKSTKTKSINEPRVQPTPKNAAGMRPKTRLQKRISKMSLKSKFGQTSSVENIERYGF